MAPVLSAYLDPWAVPPTPISHVCGTRVAHFTFCHEGEQRPPVEVTLGALQQSSSGRLSLGSSQLAKESFVNLNFWDVSAWMPGFGQTRYLPRDKIFWEINFLLKYKISPILPLQI